MAKRSVFLMLVVVHICCCQVSAQEPSPCESLRPSAQADISLAQWLLAEEKNFKRNGCWKQHIQLGEMALREAQSRKQDEVFMKLSLQLASSAFYLGDYLLSEKLAKQGYEYAVKKDDAISSIEGLYLLSAISRTRQEARALELAGQALLKYKQADLNDRNLEAKIYLNLGAAFSDVPPQAPDTARQYLQKAYMIFLDAGQTHDALRTGLRLVRVEYQLKQYEQGQRLLESLAPLVDGPRAEMLYGYQMGKVLHRQALWDEAMVYVIKAKKLALQLSASQDLQRIDELMIAINKQQFVQEPVQKEK